MRETETHGWTVHTSSAALKCGLSSAALKRTLRLAAVALSVGLVMSAGVARAQDDEEDNSTFEDKIIKNIMTGLGGTNMENQGIDYRERSPLVVPPKITLPPPDATAAAVPNWPKDPDVAQRKASAEAAKTGRPEEVLQAARPLTPAEMAPKRARVQQTGNEGSPGDPNKNIVLSPKQLGYEGGLFKNMFGGNKGETAEFKGEPTRDSLTQPPAGYQTPSSGFAYGTGPKEVMQNSANINPMTGKY
ncbi:hypothetical protein V1281_003461 [Nitrobacteraceae bacterium AZCC 2161]